jgi:asparagine synthase (glutamine-hydrolysing)
MAWSIENRVPFLSTQLAEFVYSLPEEFLISNERITKFILRRAMKGLVPEAILSRRDKIGFGTPYIAWLEAMRPELARLIAIGNHWLGVPAIRSIISQAQPFLSGSPVAPGLARRLWGLLTLLLWTDVFQVSSELDTEVTYPVREKNSSP